ncbi:unnamed protein product [Pleuronectes platessa]|uniref:MIF4G domain-containing protein n=1 Tax=Pleuronectes platessa TaxID=8262 RepID=A0A9N7UUG3_PLEPL|nr:unnamed protein product [Pleuronectes platessa]
MCSCLATLIVPTADDSPTKVNFHKLLLSRCQKEFQKEKVDDVAFETKPKMLYSAASTERDRLQVEPEEAKDITQKRFIGNIKLLCELFKHKMLNDFIVHDCLDKLLRNNDEVALECLCILLTTISKGHTCDETKMDHYLNSMEDIVTEGKTSSRIRYMLQDTIDLTLVH